MLSDSESGVGWELDPSTGVALVEFDRPPYNYFNPALIKGIGDAYAHLEDDPRSRSIVLASNGKHFCAGADFSSGRLSDEEARFLYDQAARLFSFSLPVVAAVQGRAVGGGLGLALSADFRVAAPSTKFACNFALLGTHHGFGLSVTLPSVVGQQRALQLLYTGATMDGASAATIGLCDQLVNEDAVRGEAISFARRIAAASPLAVRAIRRTMWSNDYPAKIRAATEEERKEQNWLFETEDFREGVKAASERRPPSFSAR